MIDWSNGWNDYTKLRQTGNLSSNIHEFYNRHIFWQEEATKVMTEVLSDSYQTLYWSGDRPLSVLFFKWPTGVGKTAMAMQTAKLLFDNINWYTRVDCSQLTQPHEASAVLFGAPAWYVWYGKAARLHPSIVYKPRQEAKKTNQLHKIAKNRKNMSLILLDEIEKMNHHTRNILLWMMDSWSITLNDGSRLMMSNTIVVFTSNVGEAIAANLSSSIGFWDKQTINQNRRMAKKDELLKKSFSPEFLWRIDHIVEFEPLQMEHVDEILATYKQDLIARILMHTKWKITLQFDEQLDSYIKTLIDVSKWYRSLKKIRDNTVVKKLWKTIKINRLENREKNYSLKIVLNDEWGVEFLLRQEQPKALVVVNQNREVIN